jgi:hypothetical protein
MNKTLLVKRLQQFVCLHDMRIVRKPIEDSDCYILVDRCEKCDYEISPNIYQPPPLIPATV